MRRIAMILGLLTLAACGADGEPARPTMGASVGVGPGGVSVGTRVGVKIGGVNVGVGLGL